MAFKPERRVLLKNGEILQIINKVAKEVAAKFLASGNKDISLVCVLKSALPFATELQRQLKHLGVDAKMHYVSASSYDDKTTSNGQPKFERYGDVLKSIDGTFVCVVDDMIDTGATLRGLIELLANDRNIVNVAVLLEKIKDHVDLISEWLGTTIVGILTPDVWVDGFGIDTAKEHRELPNIYAYIGTAHELLKYLAFRNDVEKIARRQSYNKRQARHRELQVH